MCYYWKVTRSLVSYDLVVALQQSCLYIERSPDHWWVTTCAVMPKRHQALIERSPDHWWVTTNRVIFFKALLLLKGHQIIGELRQMQLYMMQQALHWKVPDHWWVTTQTMHLIDTRSMIERSPDHWWVTTNSFVSFLTTSFERSPAHWWVTTNICRSNEPS